MTKQERNNIILQALQVELQEKPYAKDALEETYELWVQDLIRQANALLKQDAAQQSQDTTQTEVAPQ